MNSCNPVFIELGLRLGADDFYHYFEQFGLLSKTGIDLPGEAATIMHKKDNIGQVELATISFGQSFQITPIQLVTTAASLINGGRRVTPHFGVSVQNAQGETIHTFSYDTTEGTVSTETSETHSAACWKKSCRKEPEKKRRLKGIPSVARRRLLRRFQEANINISHLFLDLHRQRIHRSLDLS